jgi:hypothetical protein
MLHAVADKKTIFVVNRSEMATSRKLFMFSTSIGYHSSRKH